MVSEHQGEYTSEWAAIQSIAAKIGSTAETLRRWLRESQKAVGGAQELGGGEPGRIKALEREVRELRQANEILRKASAYFAQAELDRPFKR
jgi:transposase-like protein